MDDVRDNGPTMADTLQQLADFIGKFIVAAGPMAGLSFKVLDILAQDLNSIPMPVLQVLAPLLLGVAAAIKVVRLAMLLLDANPIILIISAVALAAVLIVMHWNTIKNAMKAAWDWIHKNVLTPLANFFTKTIPSAATTVWHAIRDAWNSVKGAMQTAYSAVKRNVLDPIVHFFTRDIPSAGGKVVTFFSGLPGKITRATKGMWDGIKNTFRSAINGLIDIWNNFHLTMPAVKVLGHTIIPGFTIKTPDLKHLATGGITGGGLAMVGENGPELVRLPSGSSVMNNGATQRAMAGGGATKVDLTINSSNRPIDRVLLELLRDAIRRYNGGNVQAALGS
jgi:phage-related protein